MNTKISRCYNEGTINGSSTVGGIIGYICVGNNSDKNTNFNMSQTYNKGNVIGSTSCAGGIVGSFSINTAYYEYVSAYIANCYNMGNVDAKGSSKVAAGIIGQCSFNTDKGYLNYFNLVETYNSGKITENKGTASGIIGTLSISSPSDAYVKLDKCYNEGMIEAIYLAGIVGSSGTQGITVSNCYYKTGTAPYGRGGNSNLGCVSTTKEDIIARIENLDAFVEDTEGINNGYPILAWQVQTE